MDTRGDRPSSTCPDPPSGRIQGRFEAYGKALLLAGLKEPINGKKWSKSRSLMASQCRSSTASRNGGTGPREAARPPSSAISAEPLDAEHLPGHDEADRSAWHGKGSEPTDDLTAARTAKADLEIGTRTLDAIAPDLFEAQYLLEDACLRQRGEATIDGDPIRRRSTKPLEDLARRQWLRPP